jgi:hypothetical protein
MVRRPMRIAAAMLTAGLAAAHGATPQARQGMPPAGQVFDAYVNAIGGLAALERVKNRVSTAVMSIPAAGVSLTVTTYQARPHFTYLVIDSAATGKIESGSNGTVAWRLSATAGPQLIEGKEKALQLNMNVFDRLVYWQKTFDAVETAGVEDVAGRPCYRVVATKADIAPQTYYFDQVSHLLLKFVTTLETEAGSIPMESTVDDYRPIDGVLQPHKTTVRSLGQERIVTMSKIEQNVDLPADRLALPPEIAKLVKK